jgi:hypothetical protein
VRALFICARPRGLRGSGPSRHGQCRHSRGRGGSSGGARLKLRRSSFLWPRSRSSVPWAGGLKLHRRRRCRSRSHGPDWHSIPHRKDLGRRMAAKWASGASRSKPIPRRRRGDDHGHLHSQRKLTGNFHKGLAAAGGGGGGGRRVRVPPRPQSPAPRASACRRP